MDFEAVVNSRRSVHHFQSGVEIPAEHLTKIVEAVQELLGCDSLPFSAAVIGLPAEQPKPRIAPDHEKIHFVK